jgi:hypothetical protein
MQWSRFAPEINTKMIFRIFNNTRRPTTVVATSGHLEMLIMYFFMLLHSDSKDTDRDCLRH